MWAIKLWDVLAVTENIRSHIVTITLIVHGMNQEIGGNSRIKFTKCLTQHYFSSYFVNEENGYNISW